MAEHKFLLICFCRRFAHERLWRKARCALGLHSESEFGSVSQDVDPSSISILVLSGVRPNIPLSAVRAAWRGLTEPSFMQRCTLHLNSMLGARVVAAVVHIPHDRCGKTAAGRIEMGVQ